MLSEASVGVRPFEERVDMAGDEVEEGAVQKPGARLVASVNSGMTWRLAKTKCRVRDVAQYMTLTSGWKRGRVIGRR